MDGFFWFMLGVATALLILYCLMRFSNTILMPGEIIRNKLLKQVPREYICTGGYLYFIYKEYVLGIDISEFNIEKIYNIHIKESKSDNVVYVCNNVLSNTIKQYVDKYISVHNSIFIEDDEDDVIESQITVDDVLDKIIEHGIDSLSETEKNILNSQKK